MPDIFGNPTEAELRGQQTTPSLLGYAPPTRAELEARDAAARAGMGTVTMSDGRTFTGDAFRSSTDPAVVALREQMLGGGRSDPNLLFGGTDGRTQSDAERRYREQYSNFMNNPNDGVSGSEAARAVGLWALAPIAGYAFAPAGGAAGAGAGAVDAAAMAAGGGVAPAAGAAGGAGAAAGTGAGFAGYGVMGGMQPNAGLGVFANGGQAGMAGVGGGNMGALAAEQAAAGGGLLGGLAKDLGQNIAQSYVKNLLSGGESGGGVVEAPMGLLNPTSTPAPAPMRRQSAPLDQSVTRMRGYGRTPIQFRGSTVWL